MAESYENLKIWKEAIQLAAEIYDVSKKFPHEERYGLTSQIRRAAVSISSNIAEGSGRTTKKDFSRFIDISIGSLNEVESLLFVAKELQYIKDKDFAVQIDIIKKLGNSLGAFRKYLNRK